MRYYLQNPDDQAITGSFELEDIEAMFKAGKIPAGTLATGDFGEGLAQIRRAPAEDWMQVESIPGFGQERPPTAPLRSVPPPSPPTVLLARPAMPEALIIFCPFCRQQTSGEVVLGETRCEHCGKLLYPTAEAVERRHLAPSRLVSTLEFAAGLIGGLIAQVGSFVMVCGFVALSLRKDGARTTIAFAVLLCLAWVAIAIPLTRSPTNRGFAFGILLGVGLTALITANCSLQ